MARVRPNVLFLSQCLPYPPSSGVTNRTFHILRELQRAFDVTLVAFSRINHQRDATARQLARQELGRVVHSVMEPTPVPGDRSRLAKAMVHIKSLTTGRSYIDFEYQSIGFGARVREALDRDRPAIVHLDSLDLHRWGDSLKGFPITCTHHNIESELLRLRGAHHPSRIFGRYLMLQAERYAAVERDKAPGFALNLMMSETDADRLRAMAPGSVTACIPNGVDPSALRPAGEAAIDSDLVGFLGPAYMYPNRDGMEYFLAEVWPRVRLRRPGARLRWIGRVTEAERTRFERVPGVECAGFVEDLGAALASPACLVVPLRIGGGTRLKILDAWAAGKAMVSTSVGCEGLETQDGTNILIRDEPGAFADAVVDLLDHPAERKRIGEAARRTVEAAYSWAAIGERLIRQYQDLLGMPAPRPS